MTRSEDGQTIGKLSGYISDTLSQEEARLAAIREQARLSEQARQEEFIQSTSPLREHLLKLAAPFDELFDRFHARELLEEIGTYRLFHPNRPPLLRTKPEIYADIVIAQKRRDPSLPNYRFVDPKTGEEREFTIEELSDPDVFSAVIPHLDPYYGLELTCTYTKEGPVIYTPIYEERAMGSFTSGSGGEMHTESHVGPVKVGERVDRTWVNRTRAMSVVAERDGGMLPLRGLRYRLTESDSQRVEEWGSGLVTGYDPPDSLKRMIGDNLLALKSARKIDGRDLYR